MIYHGKGENKLDDLNETVDNAVVLLRRRKQRFDSIVVRGMSGVIVGSPVALRLKVPLVVVRKPDEGSHAGDDRIINVKNIGERWVFLDDFVSTGRTRLACETAIIDHWKEKVGPGETAPKRVGEFLYRDMEWHPCKN